MPMTSLEASTTCLAHCEDFTNSGSVKSIGIQSYAPQPVSTTTSVAKFGSRSIDVYTADFGGLRWPGAASIFSGLAATIEGFVYIRNFRSSPRLMFGVYSGPTVISLSLVFGVSHDPTGKPVGYYVDNGNNLNYVVGPSALPLNQWVHLALTIDEAGLRRLFVDGTQVDSSSAVIFGGLASARNVNLGLGGIASSGGVGIDGCVDEVRYVYGHALNNGTSFTVPTSPYADSPAIDGASNLLPLKTKLTGSYPSIAKQVIRPLTNVKDVYYGGRGQIIATVKEKNTPVNTPLRRKVWLIRERDAQIVRETWSDAVTGNYAFTHIDPTEKYTVVSYDYLHNYRAVIADNLTPELMP